MIFSLALVALAPSGTGSSLATIQGNPLLHNYRTIYVCTKDSSSLVSLLRTGKRVFAGLLPHRKGILKVDPFPSPFSKETDKGATSGAS